MTKTRVQIEVDPKVRARWESAAHARGQDLAAWVNDVLNAATAVPEDVVIPTWMNGLSHRSAKVLVLAGFQSRFELLQVTQRPNWEWADLPHSGPDCAQEIRRWLRGD